MAIATAAETRIARCRSSKNRNGSTTGNVDRNTSTKMRIAAWTSRHLQGGDCRHLRQIAYLRADPVEPVVADRAHDQRWELGRDDGPRPDGIRGASHGSHEMQFAAARHQGAQDVHHAVHHAPRSVAADGCDHHRAHVVASGRSDAERAGEGEAHEQAEQDLRVAVERVEDRRTLARLRRRHRIDLRPCDARISRSERDRA